jgi:Fe2+ transport system protein FeoA
MLRFLDEKGIRPGAGLRVLWREPFGGAVVVAAGGGETPIGPDLAARMLVVPEGPA